MPEFTITVSDTRGHLGYDAEGRDMDEALMESGVIEENLSERDEGTVTIKIEAK